jgi:hypothetical protein
MRFTQSELLRQVPTRGTSARVKTPAAALIEGAAGGGGGGGGGAAAQERRAGAP